MGTAQIAIATLDLDTSTVNLFPKKLWIEQDRDTPAAEYSNQI